MSQYGYSDFYKRVWGHDGSDAHFEVMAKYFADKLQPLLPSDLSAVILEIGCGIGFAIAGLGGSATPKSREWMPTMVRSRPPNGAACR